MINYNHWIANQFIYIYTNTQIKLVKVKKNRLKKQSVWPFSIGCNKVFIPLIIIAQYFFDVHLKYAVACVLFTYHSNKQIYTQKHVFIV